MAELGGHPPSVRYFFRFAKKTRFRFKLVDSSVVIIQKGVQLFGGFAHDLLINGSVWSGGQGAKHMLCPETGGSSAPDPHCSSRCGRQTLALDAPLFGMAVEIGGVVLQESVDANNCTDDMTRIMSACPADCSPINNRLAVYSSGPVQDGFKFHSLHVQRVTPRQTG